MKALAPLFLFLLSAPAISQAHQNRPGLTEPLLQAFVLEAEARGVNVRERLAELDSVKVADPGGYAAASYEWRGNVEWITITPDAFQDPESNRALFLFTHEVGHHFKILDCCECRYNITACNYSERAVFLSKDAHLRKLFFDNFFKRLKDPAAPHEHF